MYGLQRRCRDDTGLELQQQLEETVKSQRCRLLALQSHLQCALEAGQAALPAFRTEMDSIRKLTLEWSDVANEQLAWLRSEFTQQIIKLFASEESASLAMLDEAQSQNKKLGDEKEKLQEDLMVVRLELDKWKKQCVEWQEEKKSLVASAQLRLQQREEELEQQRLEQLNQQKLEHKKTIQTLQEAVKVAEEKYRVVVSDWQSASEQVSVINSPVGLIAAVLLFERNKLFPWLILIQCAGKS